MCPFIGINVAGYVFLFVPLHNPGCGSAMSSLVKLRFPALPLLSPCTGFAKVSLRLGSIGAAGTVSLLLTYTVRTVRTLPSCNQRNDIYRL